MTATPTGNRLVHTRLYTVSKWGVRRGVRRGVRSPHVGSTTQDKSRNPGWWDRIGFETRVGTPVDVDAVGRVRFLMKERGHDDRATRRGDV